MPSQETARPQEAADLPEGAREQKREPTKAQGTTWAQRSAREPGAAPGLGMVQERAQAQVQVQAQARVPVQVQAPAQLQAQAQAQTRPVQGRRGRTPS